MKRNHRDALAVLAATSIEHGGRVRSADRGAPVGEPLIPGEPAARDVARRERSPPARAGAGGSSR
ncbi:hypothetical protein [Actinoplanes siamensis]|uniref:Uncharacterized protein n=1 Tax=Actinoplanes siamensis TaxID=1223317 RepID=A0A919TNM9_9ACTN|nr:hypothetical protein [Actinoplanes siamensis]GIF08934.1 hypothetical protein Asi03nite_64720 [Actinoplanes siamensis]